MRRAAGLRRRCGPGGAGSAPSGTAACIGMADEETAAARPRPPKAQGPLPKSCPWARRRGPDYAGPFWPASRACQAVRSPSCAPHHCTSRPAPARRRRQDGGRGAAGGRPHGRAGCSRRMYAGAAGPLPMDAQGIASAVARPVGHGGHPYERRAAGAANSPAPRRRRGVREGGRHVVAVLMERRAEQAARCAERHVPSKGMLGGSAGRAAPVSHRPPAAAQAVSVPFFPGRAGGAGGGGRAPLPPPRRSPLQSVPAAGGMVRVRAAARRRSMSAAPGAAGWDSAAAPRAVRGQGSSRQARNGRMCGAHPAAKCTKRKGGGGAAPAQGTAFHPAPAPSAPAHAAVCAASAAASSAAQATGAYGSGAPVPSCQRLPCSCLAARRRVPARHRGFRQSR